MSDAERPTCGRCGVYRHLHPTTTCAKPRHAWWWERHSALRHVRAWLWIHGTTQKFRYAYCQHLAAKGRDWCELVDCWYRVDTWDDWKSDYSGAGCLCDFALPHDVGAPRPGWCYCAPEVPS